MIVYIKRVGTRQKSKINIFLILNLKIMLEVQNGDLLLNFFRSVAYRFDKTNKEHLKDLFRCRYATFEEIEKFETLNKDVCTLSELGIKSEKGTRWKSRDFAKITIYLEFRDIANLYKYGKKNGLNSYLAVIRSLLTLQKEVIKREVQNEFSERENELKEKESVLDNIAQAFKDLSNYFNK